jgi:serine protease inhibitor
MRRVLTMIPLLAAVAAGCESLAGPRNGRQAPLTELPRALTVAERDVIRASNGFAFDILRETVARAEESNIFLSPLSASMALGMTMNGAVDETYDGMRRALGFGDLDRAGINASYRGLIDLLRGLDRGVEMRVANSIWAADGFTFHQTFFDEAKRYFDAEVATLDFGSPAAVATINEWAARNTNNRIPKVLDGIDPDLVMILMNAIYFNGQWTDRFDRARTGPAPFQGLDGAPLEVQMMRRSGGARMARVADAVVLELPYGRDAFAMTVVLPDPGVRVDDIIASLDADVWDAWLGDLMPTEVEVGLPRFRLEYETIMNEPLMALGMERAFTSAADFSRMSPAGKELEIAFVKQNTFLDVHEEGTEAAAVTTVGMRVTSAPPSIVVDRPFVLAIRERFSGTILFLGRIGAPGR